MKLNRQLFAIHCAGRCLRATLLLGLSFLFVASAQAQKRWDGGGGNNRWSTSNNWNSNGQPNSSATVIFDNTFVGTLPSTIQLRGNRTANILTFDTGDSLSLINGSGSRALNLYSGQINRTSGSSGSQGLAFTYLDLQTNGVFDINGSGTFTISSRIRDEGGSWSVTKTGSGLLVLSGANEYLGSTNIGTSGGASGGTLRLGANNVLPSTAVTIYAGILDINTRTDTIGSLTLGGGAGGTTASVTGTSGTLTLGGNITYSATNNPNGATISSNVALGGNRVVNVGDSTAASDDLTISGVISGSGQGITKSGSGNLLLSGANTYSGATSVSAGTVTISNASALGTGSTTTVSSGAALRLTNNINVSSETNLSLAGAGVGGAGGALENVSGTNTWDGNISLTGAATITSSASELILGSDSADSVSLGANTLTLDADGGDMTVNSVISGTGGMTKEGAGTVELSSVNTYTGGTTVNDGTLVLSTGGASGTIRGALTINSGGTVEATATDAFGYGSDGGAKVDTVAINGGTLINSISAPNGNLGWGVDYTLSNGALMTSNGGVSSNSSTSNFTFGGNTGDPSSVHATAGTSTIAGHIVMRGDSGNTHTTLTVDGGAILDITAGISSATGSTGLIKSGAGTLQLSGDNTYTNSTTINAGTLLAQSDGALGSTSGDVTVTSGGTLALDGGLTIDKSGATTNLAGTGAGGAGALAAVGSTGSTTQYDGDLNLTANATITAADNLLVLGDNDTFLNTIATNGHTLTLNTTSATGVTPTYGPFPAYTLDDANIYITGTITGSGGLTKTGAGTASLVSFPSPGQAYTGDTVVTGGKLIVDGVGQIDGFYDPTINSTNVIVGNASSPGSADSVILQMGQLASPAAPNYLIGYYDIGTNTATTNLTVYEDGLFNLNGGSNRLNTLTLQGGHVTGRDLATYNPLLTIVNGVTTNASSQTAVIEELNLGMSANGFTFNIADGAADQDLRIDGIVQNGIGFTAANSADSMVKTGLGTMVLTNANSYQGVTSIDQGVLRITNNGALGQFGTFGSLDNGTTVASGAQLQLDGSSGALTIGTETLTLNGTGVSNTGALLNTAGDNTYKGFVFLESDARINAATGTTLEIGNYTGPGNTLNVNGGIMNGATAGQDLTVGGSGNTIINGAIGNYVQDITKDGTGTLTLAGNNSYSGATAVTSGAVKVTHSSGLAGTGATVSDGAALQFAQDANNANINVVAVSSTIQGTGISNGGAIQNLNGTNTYQGAITLADDARITANTGSSLTLTGNVALGGNTLDAGGLGNTTYNGVISNGAFTKTDTGTVTLGGSSANTFTGGLQVNNGTLNLNKTAGVNAVGAGSTVTIGDNIGSASSANLVYQASNQMPDSTDLVINADGRLVMGTYTDSISSIAGTGLIDLGTTGVLTIGADDSNSVYDGSITGSGTLVKDGTGSLTFTEDISYTGTLEVGGGTLVLSGMDLTVTNLIITADTILDFSGLDSRIFATNFSFLSDDITLNIINWTKNADGFFATNWLGATQDLVNNGGAKPMSQILFDGLNPGGDPWTWNDTGWDSYNDEIYPRVPEPSTYGAILTAATLALLAYRKRKTRQLANADKA
ncbi:MAG: autotransporter-associated beta strand repeat-containing protein [Opitutaceae bacterium]